MRPSSWVFLRFILRVFVPRFHPLTISCCEAPLFFRIRRKWWCGQGLLVGKQGRSTMQAVKRPQLSIRSGS